jgi:hypothetical protein
MKYVTGGIVVFLGLFYVIIIVMMIIVKDC